MIILKKLNPLFIKTKYDGKSYKIKPYTKYLKFRFNKVNLNILICKNVYEKININTKIIKYYPLFKNNIISKPLKKVRVFNTYTKRGLLTPTTPFLKRTGRVSGYV